MHKFIISIHLLCSSTCFEHFCTHLQEDNCISAASGIVTLWLFSTQVTRGSSHNLCTEQSQSDSTRCCNNKIVIHLYVPLHVSSTIVLIFSRTAVSVQHLVSSLSLGDRSTHVTSGQSSCNLCTEQSQSDNTRCCTNTIVLLKMSTLVLETCGGT